MPHLTIEHSANLQERVDLSDLASRLHKAALDTGIFPEKGLRTRLATRNEYRIADGNEDNAFIHLVVRIGFGRDLETRKRAGDAIFHVLCETLAEDQDQNPLALSCEIQEIDPELSWKKNNLAEWIDKRSRESA